MLFLIRDDSHHALFIYMRKKPCERLYIIVVLTHGKISTLGILDRKYFKPCIDRKIMNMVWYHVIIVA